MQDFRCSNCNKLLAKIGIHLTECDDPKNVKITFDGARYFKVEIKCPKCTLINLSEPTDMSYDKIIEPFNKTMITYETKK